MYILTCIIHCTPMHYINSVDFICISIYVIHYNYTCIITFYSRILDTMLYSITTIISYTLYSRILDTVHVYFYNVCTCTYSIIILILAKTIN